MSELTSPGAWVIKLNGLASEVHDADNDMYPVGWIAERLKAMGEQMAVESSWLDIMQGRLERSEAAAAVVSSSPATTTPTKGQAMPEQPDIALSDVHHAIDRLWSQYTRDRGAMLQYRNYPSPRLDLASTQELLDELAARYIAQAAS